MNLFTKKINYKIIIAILLIFIAGLELFLRFHYGFCDAVLLKESADFEYIASPNQTRRRFGNSIFYNSKSMRSAEFNEHSEKILGFGDSVINGGTLTDQDSLATSLLSNQLSVFLNREIQFLNISAGSWGPDNCFAYLKKYGDFGAKKIVLFVSSHDAYDNMNFGKIVGVNESFPNEQYYFAISELVNRYALPKLGYQKNNQQTDNLGINKKTSRSRFNTGFQSFFDYAKSNHISLQIYLHADKQERKQKKYNDQGQEIIKFCETNNVTLIKDMDCSFTEEDFRDNIHLSNSGQRKMADLVFNSLRENFEN